MTETVISDLYPRTAEHDAAATLVYRLQEDEPGGFAFYQADAAVMWEVVRDTCGWMVRKIDLRAGRYSRTNGGFRPSAVCRTLQDWGLPSGAEWAPIAPKAPSPSYVYLIGSEGIGLVKIGRSEDVARRLTDIQRMCPVPLKVLWTTPGGEELEARLHCAFAGQRAHGEWFALGDDPVATVREEVGK